MNANERTQLPPPLACVSCQKYTETRSSDRPTRYDCISGHPMHEMCGWRVAKTEPIPGAK